MDIFFDGDDGPSRDREDASSSQGDDTTLSSHSEGDASSSQLSGKKRKQRGKGKRGIVAMKKVIDAKKNGIKIQLTFNIDGQPIGPNKSTFVDYIGLLARTEVPLTTNDWRDAKDSVKQKIWEDVEHCFEVDESHMHMTLKKVGKAARDFRANLSKHCYDDEGNPILQPPVKYAKLEVVNSSWLGFVDEVGGERFKKMSEANTKSAKSKSHLCRLGALGYAQFKETIKDQVEKEPPARQRLIVWKEARRKRNGNVKEDVQRVVDEGESITDTLTNEELLTRGPNDVLAKVVKKEYHGRVLTAGYGVTKKDFFRKRRDSSSDAEVYRLTQFVLQMEKRMEQMGSQLLAVSQAQVQDKGAFHSPPVHVSPIGLSEVGSCPTFDPDNIPKGESICDMYVDSPSYVKVGSGSVFRKEGQNLHSVPLKADQVRVCFSEIVIGHEDTPLPCPYDKEEINTVGRALRTFVAWPIRLVSLQRKVSGLPVSKDTSLAQSVTAVGKAKPAYPREGDIEHHACYPICKALEKRNAISEIFSSLMSESFWGAAFTDSIGVENLREVLTRGWLSATSICFYIRYLCDVYLVKETDIAQQSNKNVVSSRFSFISPHRVAEHTHLVDVLQKHEGQDHLVMIPYNIGKHWVLVAINTNTECIFYMDPLRVHHTHKDRAHLVHKINNVMNSYRGNKKQAVSSGKKLKQNHWVSIECPKQDLIRDLCGFFVCLFIEDILESNTTTLSSAYPQKRRCITFSEDRIAHIEMEWCGYLHNKFL